MACAVCVCACVFARACSMLRGPYGYGHFHVFKRHAAGSCKRPAWWSGGTVFRLLSRLETSPLEINGTPENPESERNPIEVS